MRVGIGNDHAAVNFKNILKEYLENKGFEVIDYGSTDPQAKDDYPDFGQAVAEALIAGKIDKGVVICGTGVGISLAANKVPGIRAATVVTHYEAKYTRLHNDANILCMGGRVIAPETALELVEHVGNRPRPPQLKTRAPERIRDLDRTGMRKRHLRTTRRDRLRRDDLSRLVRPVRVPDGFRACGTRPGQRPINATDGIESRQNRDHADQSKRQQLLHLAFSFRSDQG